VIGVTTAIISPARVSAGIGFAVPSRIVEAVVPALIEDGEYQHPFLGIEGTTLVPLLAQAMDLPETQRGALVIGVTPGGPADQAGLQGSEDQATLDGVQVPVGGDVITALNGEPVNSMITQLARVGQVGQTITLTIIRDGQEQQVELVLQPRPTTPEPELQEVEEAWLGILATTLTPAVAEAMGLPAGQTGVLVGQVVPGSPAEEAGLLGSSVPAEIDGQELLVGGDIIVAIEGLPLANMQSLQQILSQAAPGDEITLTILREGQQLEVPVTLGRLPQ
jgi:S1-C subfamily serine protease